MARRRWPFEHGASHHNGRPDADPFWHIGGWAPAWVYINGAFDRWARPVADVPRAAEAIVQACTEVGRPSHASVASGRGSQIDIARRTQQGGTEQLLAFFADSKPIGDADGQQSGCANRVPGRHPATALLRYECR